MVIPSDGPHHSSLTDVSKLYDSGYKFDAEGIRPGNIFAQWIRTIFRAIESKVYGEDQTKIKSGAFNQIIDLMESKDLQDQNGFLEGITLDLFKEEPDLLTAKVKLEALVTLASNREMNTPDSELSGKVAQKLKELLNILEFELACNKMTFENSSTIGGAPPEIDLTSFDVILDDGKVFKVPSDFMKSGKIEEAPVKGDPKIVKDYIQTLKKQGLSDEQIEDRLRKGFSKVVALDNNEKFILPHQFFIDFARSAFFIDGKKISSPLEFIQTLRKAGKSDSEIRKLIRFGFNQSLQGLLQPQVQQHFLDSQLSSAMNKSVSTNFYYDSHNNTLENHTFFNVTTQGVSDALIPFVAKMKWDVNTDVAEGTIKIGKRELFELEKTVKPIVFISLLKIPETLLQDFKEGKVFLKAGDTLFSVNNEPPYNTIEAFLEQLKAQGMPSDLIVKLLNEYESDMGKKMYEKLKEKFNDLSKDYLPIPVYQFLKETKEVRVHVAIPRGNEETPKPNVQASLIITPLNDGTMPEVANLQYID